METTDFLEIDGHEVWIVKAPDGYFVSMEKNVPGIGDQIIAHLKKWA